MEVEQSIKEHLAQAMIDLRKGPSSSVNSSTSIYQRRDYLVSSIKDSRKQIDLLKKENDILSGLREKTETIRYQINHVLLIDAHLTPENQKRRTHDTREKSIQTDPVRPNRQGPNYMLLKKSEYQDVVSFIQRNSSDVNSSLVIEIENDKNVPPINVTNVQSNYSSSWPATATITSSSKTPTNNNINTNNGSNQTYEESDDEGVQLLLSMKRNVFNCKCGQFINSISYWSEHQGICSISSEKTMDEQFPIYKNIHQRVYSKSTEKPMGEQCPICKKIFLTCVALNIHSTKKHNKKKVRTDSVMHCPCGQSFTAKWRQNCVHKLNSHGRHCKAFKEIETQCTVCKKGFIDRKSLEYHGLKAHKLAVPINS